MHSIRRESEIKDFRVWCTLDSQSSLLLSVLQRCCMAHGRVNCTGHGVSQLDETKRFNEYWYSWIAWHEPAWQWPGWRIVVCLCGSQGWLQSWSGSMPCPWGILWGEEAKEISDSKDTSVPKPASTNPWQLRLCNAGCFPWSWAECWMLEDTCAKSHKD